jgi:hypothetical protein
MISSTYVSSSETDSISKRESDQSFIILAGENFGLGQTWRDLSSTDTVGAKKAIAVMRATQSGMRQQIKPFSRWILSAASSFPVQTCFDPRPE